MEGARCNGEDRGRCAEQRRLYARRLRVYVALYASVAVYMFGCICLCICIFVWLYMPLYLYICLAEYASVSVCLLGCIRISICVSIQLCAVVYLYLYLYVPVWLFAIYNMRELHCVLVRLCPSVRIRVCLSVCGSPACLLANAPTSLVARFSVLPVIVYPAA